MVGSSLEIALFDGLPKRVLTCSGSTMSTKFKSLKMVVSSGSELVGKARGFVGLIPGSGPTPECKDESNGTMVLLFGSSGFSMVSVGEAPDGASRASLEELSPLGGLWYLVAELVPGMVWPS